MMIKKLFLGVLIFLAGSLSAKEIRISSAVEINSKNWGSGDTLVFNDGIYPNQQIILRGAGLRGKPIVLKAQTAGKVIFTENSRIEIGGEYIVVEGLQWKGGYSTAGKAVVSFRADSDEAQYSSLVNCLIEEFNPSNLDIDYKWVSLYGSHNQIRECSFINKKNLGTLLVVWLTKNEPNYHQIINNYFGKRLPLLDSDGKEINGQEIIRIGDSATSFYYSTTSVENNLFDQCDGEIETISNKSCGNIYRNNLFLECKGTLTLRHGNDCMVDGNYFIGNSKNSTGGVRIIGEKHRVINNYFENLTGTGYRSALCTVKGVPDSQLNGYFQVHDALIACNTFINCKNAFRLNYGSGSQTEPIQNSVIALNILYNNASNSLLQSDNNLSGVTCRLNLYNLGNIPSGNNGFIQSNTLKMERDATSVYVPLNGSSAFQTTSSQYPEIDHDLRGNPRIGFQCAGAVQNISAIPLAKPDKDNTGVRWLRESSDTSVSSAMTRLKQYLYYDGTYIRVRNFEDIKHRLFLSSFNLNGCLVSREEISDCYFAKELLPSSSKGEFRCFVLHDELLSKIDLLQIIL